MLFSMTSISTCLASPISLILSQFCTRVQHTPLISLLHFLDWLGFQEVELILSPVSILPIFLLPNGFGAESVTHPTFREFRLPWTFQLHHAGISSFVPEDAAGAHLSRQLFALENT